MRLDDITPMILAYNEERNIERCLSALRWAKRVVVVDSFSDDGTVEMCRAHDGVDLVQRPFESAARQGNFGLSLVESEWVLSLDADYVVTDDLMQEIRALSPDATINGYWVRFVYCVFGLPLRGTLYPPRKVLYRRAWAQYFDDGHTQRVRVPGGEGRLSAPILHDDRKDLARWFRSQARYAQLEAAKLATAGVETLRPIERVRRAKYLAAFLNLLWCLVVKRTILDGRAGWYYAFQRMIAELMLSVCLLDRDLREGPGERRESDRASGQATQTCGRDNRDDR